MVRKSKSKSTTTGTGGTTMGTDVSYEAVDPGDVPTSRTPWALTLVESLAETGDGWYRVELDRPRKRRSVRAALYAAARKVGVTVSITSPGDEHAEAEEVWVGVNVRAARTPRAKTSKAPTRSAKTKTKATAKAPTRKRKTSAQRKRAAVKALENATKPKSKSKPRSRVAAPPIGDAGEEMSDTAPGVE